VRRIRRPQRARRGCVEGEVECRTLRGLRVANRRLCAVIARPGAAAADPPPARIMMIPPPRISSPRHRPRRCPPAGAAYWSTCADAVIVPGPGSSPPRGRALVCRHSALIVISIATLWLAPRSEVAPGRDRNHCDPDSTARRCWPIPADHHLADRFSHLQPEVDQQICRDRVNINSAMLARAGGFLYRRDIDAEYRTAPSAKDAAALGALGVEVRPRRDR